MNKFFTMVLISSAVFFLAACGDNNDNNNKTSAAKSASMAAAKAAAKAQGIELTTSWPDNWPAAVPKMDGVVLTVANKGEDRGKGWSVALEIKSDETVKAYVNLLLSKGWNKQELQGEQLPTILTKDNYNVIIVHQSGTKYCSLALVVEYSD